VLELGQRERVILDAEVERAVRAAEVGDERVVGVEHERRGGAAPRDELGPAVGDDVQLAVAVELVTEEVREQDRARLDLLDDRGEPELVDLEEPEVAVQLAAAAARRRCQRAGDAADHVRPGAVVHEPRAGALEHRGDHRGGRRLAVGGRDHDAAARQAAREPLDRVRLHAREHLAGQRRAAAAAGGAGEPADGARGGKPGREAHGHGASTRSVPGRTSTVAGRSAIGSPSA
jgi:hypothetical protein